MRVARAHRFVMTLPIRYRTTTTPDWTSGTTLNISTTGVLFEGDTVPPLAQSIEMDLILPQTVGGGARVLARGAVTRLAAIVDGDRPRSRIAATIVDYDFVRDDHGM